MTNKQAIFVDMTPVSFNNQHSVYPVFPQPQTDRPFLEKDPDHPRPCLGGEKGDNYDG
jgi:hypothetical protein